MKFLLMLALILPLAAHAQSPSLRKSCDDLKNEIAAKIERNGVNAFTLEVIARDSSSDAKIVGSCNGGEQRIAYRRGNLGKDAANGRRVAAASR